MRNTAAISNSLSKRIESEKAKQEDKPQGSTQAKVQCTQRNAGEPADRPTDRPTNQRERPAKRNACACKMSESTPAACKFKWWAKKSTPTAGNDEVANFRRLSSRKQQLNLNLYATWTKHSQKDSKKKTKRLKQNGTAARTAKRTVIGTIRVTTIGTLTAQISRRVGKFVALADAVAVAAIAPIPNCTHTLHTHFTLIRVSRFTLRSRTSLCWQLTLLLLLFILYFIFFYN